MGQSERSIREKAEAAVFACAPLLPIEGSVGEGYRVGPSTNAVHGLPEEFADAAHAICELYAELHGDGGNRTRDLFRPNTDQGSHA